MVYSTFTDFAFSTVKVHVWCVKVMCIKLDILLSAALGVTTAD